MARLIVEGWRFLPHSYALVNQFQCLELLRRAEVTLLHRDAPYFRPTWREVRGIFDDRSEAALSRIPSPGEDEPAEAILRISYPYNFRPAKTPRLVVFGTAENAVVPAEFILDGVPLAEAMKRSGALVVTPSRWSREGFIASGADPRRVFVVPHGVETEIFKPMSPEQRGATRRRAGWAGEFVFLHIGAMTANKNIEPLLHAFAAVAGRFPQARLVLKGLDSLYSSQSLLGEAAKGLTQGQIALIQPRLTYLGGTLSLTQMAELYGSADAYVAPYSAEAFNLPVLEAAAFGLPVICTAGGPTDEFTTPEFAMRVESRIEQTEGGGKSLAIHLGSLIQQMGRVMEQADFRARAAMEGPRMVGERFTWKLVVDRLLEVLFPAGNAGLTGTQ